VPLALLPAVLQVLGFLNQKRPVDIDRDSVYLQADAFAILVQMDFVAADGEARCAVLRCAVLSCGRCTVCTATSLRPLLPAGTCLHV
jgi:hypothetical protein